ncbi:winged helix-turn-helix domain-containing protein [Serratia sp. JSRIV006]|uniref:winged helix-turn-helix domain-containing protein n=1 Tax=Serratia sp. JSRIV006 TaxID=2831896 RepID=UPI001CBE400D|nr:winged helix-turn-helix domain-containing protein [Serratia sp. JSRIV006]UAN65187.1 winged helix-turn-helix domain-containing protein [Serratia sp. JSRIV006]
MTKPQYLIEGDVLFCPNSVGFYHQELQEEIVTISSSAARLFSFLIKNKGEIVEREVLLQKVWDDYGLQASNNNLNQCLSTLRRIIKSMGIDKNIIETIPKVGLRIASDVAIEEIAINQGEPELPRKEKKNFLSKIKITYVLIALVIILTVTTVVHIFHIYQHYYQSDANYTAMTWNSPGCELTADPSVGHMPKLSSFANTGSHLLKRELVSSLKL